MRARTPNGTTPRTPTPTGEAMSRPQLRGAGGRGRAGADSGAYATIQDDDGGGDGGGRSILACPLPPHGPGAAAPARGGSGGAGIWTTRRRRRVGRAAAGARVVGLAASGRIGRCARQRRGAIFTYPHPLVAFEGAYVPP